MSDIFISYSRRNLEFVQPLAQSLEALGKQVWFDQKKEPLQGIPVGSMWWTEIKHGIESANNFLVVISPQSMISPYCHAEIAHALSQDKRLVSLLFCANRSQAQTFAAIDAAVDSIDPDHELPESVSADMTNVRSLARRNWSRLTQIQFVSYLDGLEWNQWLAQVIEAVDLDIDWIRTWSQFRQFVQLWVESDYSRDYLLSETRLRPIRHSIKERGQALTADEASFIQPEQQHLFLELQTTTTNHQRRQEIGVRLAELGDPRSGVGLDEDGLPDIDWVYIDIPPDLQGCVVPFHDEDDDLYGEFTLRSFYIAKYTITYAHFRAFADNDALYNQDQWWRAIPDEQQKRALFKQDIVYDNHPRDNVNWYQAIAYARWMNTVLSPPQGALEDWRIRLPTEWEWQWAATGGSLQQNYPWGKEWDNRGNTEEAKIGKSVAVGMYPHGKSATEVLDMCGNVWEWCLNKHTPSHVCTIDASDDYRVVRGGSMNHNSYYARSTFRSYLASPRDPSSVYGFRVVYASPIDP